LIYSLLHFVF